MEELPFAANKKHPDLLVHIKVSFETMLKRIEKRNRPFEQLSYDPTLYDYYKELNQRYEKWYEDYSESPKMQIDGDKFDFIEDPNAAKLVVAEVVKELTKIRN